MSDAVLVILLVLAWSAFYFLACGRAMKGHRSELGFYAVAWGFTIAFLITAATVAVSST